VSQLIEGSVRAPPAAASLMSVLNSRVFAGVAGGDDSMYNDVPQYDDTHDDVIWEGRRGSGYGEGVRRNSAYNYTGGDDNYSYSNRPKRSCTCRLAQSRVSDSPSGGKAGPGKTGSLEKDQAVALFTFEADQADDLGFEKGDIITVTKKTDKAEDWWYVPYYFILLFWAFENLLHQKGRYTQNLLWKN
jgi:SH3 domain-containing YSC84-like protein 1